MDLKEKTTYRIREFNRFFTVLIGSLNKKFLGSDFTITETRILFELISNDECKAVDLVNLLQIDKSYLSRIIKKFEQRELIKKTVDSTNKRFKIIILTEKGRKTVNKLIAMTNLQIAELISPLKSNECKEIIDAMDTITRYLSRYEEKE